MRNPLPRHILTGRRFSVLALISFAVLLTYGNTLRNGFIQDDKAEILQNPLVRDFSHIPEHFLEQRLGLLGALGPISLGQAIIVRFNT